jgi:hypothetical protein
MFARLLVVAAVILSVLPEPGIAQISRVSATRDFITFEGRADDSPLSIAELAPCQSTNDLQRADIVERVDRQGRFTMKLPRWDGARDRLYSGFLAFSNAPGGEPAASGTIRFVEDMRGASKYNQPYPHAASKKGLQVQMVDDALALGIKHAALNVNLAQMIDLTGNPDNAQWNLDGSAYFFDRDFLRALDNQVKPLSDARVLITLILLNYRSGNPALDRVVLHPKFDPKSPHGLSAFNTVTPDGLRWFKACVEFLTDRYSQPAYPHGRAVNFIVGNEVNSHWEWCNLGPASMEEFAADYLRTVRVCNTAVHKISAQARVFISLEHHWNIRFGGPTHSFAGRPFLDYFNRLAKAGGDFDWHVAFHPYPEDLTEPRTWNDKSATTSDDTPRITFKNLEMLPRYLERPELQYHGRPRRIILSEQGFNTPQNPDGEKWQAAAYCYAYYKAQRLDGIDAFILHRQVDHRDEFGLNLGLWRRNPSSANPSEPAGKKLIYEVFRQADTPNWREAFRFALPVIGIRDWRDLDRKP